MNLGTVILILSVSFYGAISSPTERDSKVTTCQNCHTIDKERINIHLIPHSHDDVGWLKTVDQYYYGGITHDTYENAGVQYIVSSVLEALENNPDRRFIQVETAFLARWWQDQNEQVRARFKQLINTGQLEIVNGAWSMNDEADASYQSIIDQFTWGLRFLTNTFGECARPKIGWQIDPFGHSREHASIIQQLGFQGLFLGRIDYRDKIKRIGEKNLEFLWQTSDDVNSSKIFTGMFPEIYGWPKNFCFDITCNKEENNLPLIDNENSPNYNLKERVEEFAGVLDKYSKYYKTKNVIIPMGEDFTYQAAEMSFANMDKLIKGFKDHGVYNVFYSTPSCYIKAVNEEINGNKNLTLTIKTDDFFPYASHPHAFWTGYFTSRPTTKRLERVANNILQASKQLSFFASIYGLNVTEEKVTMLREAVAIMQHHDAITGTEKQHVASDYVRILDGAISEAQDNNGKILSDLLKKKDKDLEMVGCLLTNVSICSVSSDKEKFVVTAYNPLSSEVSHYVRLPVNSDSFKITGSDGKEIIDYDVFEAIHKFDYITEPPSSPQPKELVFLAENISPLGAKVFYVEKSSSKKDQPLVKDSALGTFGTDETGFQIDPETHRLVSVTIQKQKLLVEQDFWYYEGDSLETNNDTSSWSSGAYIFKPTKVTATPMSTTITATEKQGNLVDEFKQIFSDELIQIIRVYKGDGENYIEFDWLVGDLQRSNKTANILLGKEVVTRFRFGKESLGDLFEDNVFYTDSNGREMIKREKDTRSDYEYDPIEEPVSSNYYPITAKIVLRNESQKLEVAVINDRPQGGTSLSQGTVELMIHRRLGHDDAFGVNEVLDEQEYGKGLYVRGQHFLTFGSTEATGEVPSVTTYERILMQKKFLPPLILLSDATSADLNTFDKFKDLFDLELKTLKASLPPEIKVLTLEQWFNDTYLLRLEHIMEKEISEKASPVNVDLKTLISGYEIGSISETTLGANQLLKDYENEGKLQWKKPDYQIANKDSGTSVSLEPMQIRTFLVKIKKVSKGAGVVLSATVSSIILTIFLVFLNH